MCGSDEAKERASGVGDNTCAEAGEGYDGHATEAQYQEAVNNELDVDSQEDGEVFSEGEMAQGGEFSGLHYQRGYWEPREALTFDTNLASMHSYLGGLGDVEDVHGDHFNGAGGAFLKLPMFYLEGIVLFPGQKLPLRVLQDRFKAAVTHAMDPENNDAPFTLGVIHVRVSRSGRIHVANYGTTAEICQLRDQMDGSVNVMTKGRQRFRILTVWTAADGALFARVQIIEEDAESLVPLSRAAFSSMASVYKRSSGRAKRAPTGQPYWTDGKSQVASEEEFVEEREDLEQEIQHLEDSRGESAAHGTRQVGQEESEDENVVVDGRNENQDGSESDDFVAAVTGEDEPDPSDEEDDNTDSHFERPRIRQRLTIGSSIGRRVEEMEPVGREPNEGRNRRVRDSAEGQHSAECALWEPESSEGRGVMESARNEEHPAKSLEEPNAVIVVAVRPESRAHANAHKKWRKDASRWSMRAQLSAWPHWVYRQFDAYDLARRAADMLRQMGDHPRMENLVSCPTALSYYVGSNMPIQDHTRQELLEIDSTLDRLKREIQLLEGMDTLRCNYCREAIAHRSDIFVMSTEGAIGTYVNAHGYVHETLTLSCARNMRISGAPQTENSWFPGYAWVLAKCQTCHLKNKEQHMGWRFTAVDPETRPRSFWGIRRTQLIGSSETQPPELSD